MLNDRAERLPLESTRAQTRTAYGLLGGVLIAGLKLIEYRWLVVEYSVEIYGGIVAAVFASVGIWLGLKLTRRTETVVVREVLAMRKIVLTFGLIAGAVLSAMMLIALRFQDQIGFGDRGAIVGYTTMVLAFLMVFFGVKSYRDNVAGGSVTFGRALKVGLLITAIATICYVATWELLYYKLAPDFSDKYAAYAVDQAKKSGATEAQIAEKRKEMADFIEMYKNPLVNIAFTTLEPLPVGLVFTLVTAGVLSREAPGGVTGPDDGSGRWFERWFRTMVPNDRAERPC